MYNIAWSVNVQQVKEKAEDTHMPQSQQKILWSSLIPQNIIVIAIIFYSDL